MAFRDEVIEAIKALAPSRRDLRNLGLTFLVALGIIGAILLLLGRPAWPYFMGAAALFGLWGLAWPKGLIWIYKIWMSLAITLGYFVSRLLLAVLFYLIITPIGLVMRLLGKDLLDIKPRQAESYWHKLADQQYDPQRTEKMY